MKDGKIDSISDLTEENFLTMLASFPSRDKIETTSDLTDDEINQMQQSFPTKLEPALYRDSKAFDAVVNDKENWKKLMVKEELTLPKDEDYAKWTGLDARKYYLKQSRSSMAFLKKAQKGSDNPGEVMGNALAGMFAGLGEMVEAMEKGAKDTAENKGDLLQTIGDAQKKQVNNPGEVNPFELMGRMMGSLMFVPVRANSDNTASTSSTASASEGESANRQEGQSEQPAIRCAQQ